MTTRSSTALLAVSFLAFLLSAACGDEGGVGPSRERAPMLTTIHGVVRSNTDSTAVPQVVVRAKENNIADLQHVTTIELTSVSTDSNGAFRISFTASCEALKTWYLTVDNHRMVRLGDNLGNSFVGNVCEVPEFQLDLWVVPE